MDYTGPNPAVRNSGTEWVRDLPEHWGVERIKNVVSVRFSNVDKHSREEEHPVRLCNYSDVYYNAGIHSDLDLMEATATEEEIERFRLAADDVLITKDSEAWDDIGVPSLVQETDGNIICGYHLALLRPNTKVLGRYLYWSLLCREVACQFHVRANGVTRFGLSLGAVTSVRMPVPPVAEQAAIARFLDLAASRVEHYIRAKEKLVALLEEQKQAFVEQAVTGQIDVRTGRRFSAYKASGFDWLGEMPEHWQMVRNGRVFAQRNEAGHPELPILEVSLRSGVRLRELGNSGRKQMMSDRSLYKRAAKGDVTYNMMRMWQGAVGVAPTDGLVSPAYVVAKPMPGSDSRYFDHLYHTGSYMTEVDKYSHGIVKDRNRLYWEDFKRMPTPCPPSGEQAVIADAVDTRNARTRACIRNIRVQIGLAREYQSRLVASVVTGKVDVRHSARHPDELSGEGAIGVGRETLMEATP